MFSALQHCHSDPLSKHHSCYNYQLLSCGCFNNFTKAWFWYLYFAQLQLFVSIWRLYLFNAHVILFYNGFLPLSISGVKENVSFFVAANWWFSVPANGLVIDEAWTWPHRHWHVTWKFRKKKARTRRGMETRTIIIIIIIICVFNDKPASINL